MKKNNLSFFIIFLVGFAILAGSFAACGVNPGSGQTPDGKEANTDGGVQCKLNSDCDGGHCQAGKCVANEVVPEAKAEALPESKKEAKPEGSVKAEVDASACLKQENWPQCQCASGWQVACYTAKGAYLGSSTNKWVADKEGKAAKTCVEVGPKGEQVCPGSACKCNCRLKATSPGSLEYRRGDEGSTYGGSAAVTNEVNKCQPPVAATDRNMVNVYICP